MNTELFKRVLSSIVIIPIVLFFILKGSFYFNFFILFCFLVTVYEWYHLNKKKDYFIYGFLFLIFSFYTVYDFRHEGVLSTFLLILIICIGTDMGGYIFGKTFKGPKLTKISPNKTYAGLFGGVFLSIIFSFLFYYNLDFLGIGTKKVISLEMLVLVIFASLVSLCGDLTISFFKRLSNIKNTGSLIPGHGGILDRIDGMIFVFPFMYILTKIFE